MSERKQKISQHARNKAKQEAMELPPRDLTIGSLKKIKEAVAPEPWNQDSFCPVIKNVGDGFVLAAPQRVNEVRCLPGHVMEERRHGKFIMNTETRYRGLIELSSNGVRVETPRADPEVFFPLAVGESFDLEVDVRISDGQHWVENRQYRVTSAFRFPVGECWYSTLCIDVRHIGVGIVGTLIWSPDLQYILGARTGGSFGGAHLELHPLSQLPSLKQREFS